MTAAPRPEAGVDLLETPRHEHMPRKRASRMLSVNAADTKISRIEGKEAHVGELHHFSSSDMEVSSRRARTR